MTLSFRRVVEHEGQIEYLFPLFPRASLKEKFPAMMKAEHFCAFALPQHGSVTFKCDLRSCLERQESMATKYSDLVAMLTERDVHVKAYYQIVHSLRSFGSGFAFKNTELGTSASVRKVFESFLHMAERIGSWGGRGEIRQRGAVKSSGAGRDQQEAEEVLRLDKSLFQKEISYLRIEASFVIEAPGNGFNHGNDGVLQLIDNLLQGDLAVLFGLKNDDSSGGGGAGFLTKRLNFVSVNDWLAQVSAVRDMLTKEPGPGGEIALSLRPYWRDITSRAKQQAEYLQSMLGYCCQRTNRAVRSSRSWNLVWSENADQEYAGMGVVWCVCRKKRLQEKH